jgi:hypothetical protein
MNVAILSIVLAQAVRVVNASAAPSGAAAEAEAPALVDAGAEADAVQGKVGGCVSRPGGGVAIGPDCSEAEARAKIAADEANAKGAEIDKADAEWAASHPKEAKAQKRAEFKAQRESLSSELCFSLEAERGHQAKIKELYRDARIAGVISMRVLHDHQTWVALWRKVEQAYRTDLREIGAKPRRCTDSHALSGEELMMADGNGAGDHGPRDFLGGGEEY